MATGLLVCLSFSWTAAELPGQAAPQPTPESRTEARLVRQQKPTYPQQFQQQGIEGTVVLWLHVSAEGDVLDAKVQRSSGHRVLDDHTLRFTRTLEFVPARQGTTAIATTILLPVRYRLVD
jgi:protein TonB